MVHDRSNFEIYVSRWLWLWLLTSNNHINYFWYKIISRQCGLIESPFRERVRLPAFWDTGSRDFGTKTGVHTHAYRHEVTTPSCMCCWPRYNLHHCVVRQRLFAFSEVSSAPTNRSHKSLSCCGCCLSYIMWHSSTVTIVGEHWPVSTRRAVSAMQSCSGVRPLNY